jgi:hypothetical protein
MRLLVVIVTVLAAAVAAAQAPGSGRDGARQRPGDSRSGTVTNPTGSESVGDPAAQGVDPEVPPARDAGPQVPQADSAVKQQAQAQRRQALEHCQTMTGASRTDCVRRADEAFKRATSDDTLSDRGPDPSLG